MHSAMSNDAAVKERTGSRRHPISYHIVKLNYENRSGVDQARLLTVSGGFTADLRSLCALGSSKTPDLSALTRPSI